MTIQPGDPNGIAEHNNLAARVAQVAALQGVTVTLPPHRSLGDPGHVDDHNLLRDAIEKVANEGGATWATATGGTESTITDGGKQYKVHTFAGNGTLTVTQAGQVEVLVVSGGGGGESNGVRGGNGGRVRDGLRTLTAGALPVVVGAGGVWNVNGLGGDSSVGGIVAPGSGFAGQANTVSGAGPAGAGLVSTITGTSVEYGKAGQPTATANTGNGTNNSGTASTGVVIVRYQI